MLLSFGFENHYKATISEPNPIPENAITAQKEEYKNLGRNMKDGIYATGWTVIRNSIKPAQPSLRPMVTTMTTAIHTFFTQNTKRVNASSKQAMMDELSEIHASNYPTIQYFHLRFVELRRELSTLKQTYDDDWCVNRVMKAIESVIKDVRFNDSANCETPDQDEKLPFPMLNSTMKPMK